MFKRFIPHNSRLEVELDWTTMEIAIDGKIEIRERYFGEEGKRFKIEIYQKYDLGQKRTLIQESDDEMQAQKYKKEIEKQYREAIAKLLT
jgi:hypothetical protein